VAASTISPALRVSHKQSPAGGESIAARGPIAANTRDGVSAGQARWVVQAVTELES